MYDSGRNSGWGVPSAEDLRQDFVGTDFNFLSCVFSHAGSVFCTIDICLMIASILALIWTVGPKIFSTGPFQFTWYTIFLLAGVLLARWIFLRRMVKAGPVAEQASGWFIGSVVVAVFFARLVFVLIEQPYLFRLRLWQAFIPFDFNGGFRFLGTDGFSAVGALAGVLFMAWWYGKKSGIGFRKLGGLAAMLFLLVMAFVRVGDFLSSSRYGTPTDSPLGMVFARPELDGLMKVPCCVMRTPDGENPLVQAKAVDGVTLVHHKTGYRPVILWLWFKPGINEQVAQEFIIGDVKGHLFDHPDHYFEPGDEPIHYTLFQEEDGSFIARIQTIGIARHPLALYEALFFLLTFLLIRRFTKSEHDHQAGLALLAGLSGHLLFDFLREAPALGFIPMHAEQVACIPFIMLGAALLLVCKKSSSPGD